jgi:hypothetical protein
VPRTSSSNQAATPLDQSLFDTPQNKSTPVSPLTSAAVVRQEANLLRFPFFALGRRGLQNHKGLLIRGQSKLDDGTYDFEYRITCNSDDLYPGQLARKVHMGLLRIMQSKQSFPFTNPIEFTWRELMDTINLVPSGRTEQQLKQAIRSIAGTRIRTKHALKNAEGRHLKSRERGYGLYTEYVFFDELLPDNETVADKNFLWLAEWYLANINSLYCSPLDHELWQRLDDISPIASRLYEFFTFNFAGDWNTLTIDYEKIARFLPVAPMRHISQINQQLGTALSLAVDSQILASTKWQFGKHGQPQLLVHRGKLLAKRGSALQWPTATEDLDTTEIRELYRQSSPEDDLVTAFHALWDSNDRHQPTSTDRTRAREILKTYGQQEAESLLPRVVEIMRERFPGAKSFGATGRYWTDAAAKAKHEELSAQRRRQEFIDQEVEEGKARQRKHDLDRWQLAWDRLSAAEQGRIQQRVLERHSPSMRLTTHTNILHRFCLRELGKQLNHR